MFCGGESIELTSTEFDLLEALARSAGRAVAREDLSESVLDRRLFPEDRTIDVHIKTLRRKFGKFDFIETVRGVGYRAREV